LGKPGLEIDHGLISIFETFVFERVFSLLYVLRTHPEIKEETDFWVCAAASLGCAHPKIGPLKFSDGF
jgi:hypothetical protein